MALRDCKAGKTPRCGIFATGYMGREEKGYGKTPLDLRKGPHVHFEVLGDRGVEDQALKNFRHTFSPQTWNHQ